MKTLITVTALLAGLAMTAGTASAASPAYCQQYAMQQANAYVPPGVGILGGAGLGAALGAGIAAATGGNVGAGAGIGAGVGGVGGIAVAEGKRKQIYDQAYWNCINSGPQPSYSDPWQACAAKYKSFQWQGPYAGMFKGYDGLWHPCPYL